MSVISVSVPVPSSGDGPAVNVAMLLGSKTVVLAGTFAGSYTLLASHDNATFVPVVTFDSGGPEKIGATFDEAYLSVRVRANAAQSALPVTMEVSGVDSGGASFFAVLPLVMPGSSGPQPVVDTYALFPPTGLEAGINFICAGVFVGSVVVEGSADGSDFAVVGTFTAGTQQRSLLGMTQNLEFGPLSTTDKTRYVRLVVQGQVSGTTTVTVGGTLASTAPPSSTTLAGAYANGTAPADQMIVLADARGGGVVVNGTSGGFTGTYDLSLTGKSLYVEASVAVGVDSPAAPTARVHVAGGTAAAGSAPLKLDQGLLMTVPESGAVESDGTHLWWTDGGGMRRRLDDAAAQTLATTYAAGSVAADQTVTLLDAKGGGVVVDGTDGGFTGAYVLAVLSANTATSLDQVAVQVTGTFAPTSGNATYEPLSIAYTVNQTGGASGTVTGILLNAVETAVVGTHDLLDLRVSSTSRFTVGRRGGTTIAQGAATSGSPTALSVVGAAHTGLTASTEDVGANFNFSATKQWATGNITEQREVIFQSPTYAFVGPSTITTAATLSVTAAPASGTNATITNSYGILVEGSYANAPDATTITQVAATATFAPTLHSNNLKIFSGSYTINQTGVSTGSVWGLFLSATETHLEGPHVPLEIDVNGVARFTVGRCGDLIIAQQVVNTGGVANATALTVVGGAHTGLLFSTEVPGANFNFSATKQWGGGNIATQREVIFQAPTYAFTGGSTVTTAATVAVTNAPQAGTNATLTNPLALWVQAGSTLFNGSVGVSTTFFVPLPSPTLLSILAPIANDPFSGGPTQGNFNLACTGGILGTLALGIGSDNRPWLQGQNSGSSTSYSLLLNPNFGGVGIHSTTTAGNSALFVDVSVVAATNFSWKGFRVFNSNGYTYTGATTSTPSIFECIVEASTVNSTTAVLTIADAYALSLTAITAGTNVTLTRSWALNTGNATFTGGQRWHTKQVTSTPYTVLTPSNAAADMILQVTNAAATTVNLPAISAVGTGYVIVVTDGRYNAAAANITLVPSGADKINNVAGNYTMNVSGMSLTLVSNGTTTNWELT